jgi:hypothetical protein
MILIGWFQSNKLDASLGPLTSILDTHYSHYLTSVLFAHALWPLLSSLNHPLGHFFLIFNPFLGQFRTRRDRTPLDVLPVYAEPSRFNSIKIRRVRRPQHLPKSLPYYRPHINTVKPLYKDALGITIYILMKRYPCRKKSRGVVVSEKAPIFRRSRSVMARGLREIDDWGVLGTIL